MDIRHQLCSNSVIAHHLFKHPINRPVSPDSEGSLHEYFNKNAIYSFGRNVIIHSFRRTWLIVEYSVCRASAMAEQLWTDPNRKTAVNIRIFCV